MKMIINGEWVDSSDKQVINVINPATGEVAETVPQATAEDVQKALEVAQCGKKIWGAYKPERRAEILIHAAELFREEQNTIATLETRETGKTYQQALAEIDNVCALFTGYAELIRHRYETVLPNESDLIYVTEEPLGVVVCVIPFNFPVDLFSYKVAPALAAGNAVIVKPASETPTADIYMVDVLIRAGIPKEAIQVITGKGSVVGRMLAESPMVNGITLTGSTAAGIDVNEHAAKNLTRVMLELGGNDSLIILDDADIDETVQMVIDGRIFNAGQICIANKRLLVHKNIREAFTNALVERLKKVVIGDPFDPKTEMGSLVSEAAADQVEKQVAYTVAQGAKCILGGHKIRYGFFEPTVLVDVTPDMDIAKDLEVFGPVFPIIEFDTDEEAIAITNQSSYGLSGGIATANTRRGIAMAKQIDSGGVVIHGTGMYRTVDMPFSGHKHSGLGIGEGMSVSLEEMSIKKSIVIKNAL